MKYFNRPPRSGFVQPCAAGFGSKPLPMRIHRLIMVILLACASAAQGTVWGKYPLTELVADHPLIVLGEIVRVRQTSRRGEAIDIAYIRVEKVLKDTLPKNARRYTNEIPLLMPSTRDETMSTADVTHPVHAQGIWFLSSLKRVFHTRHPTELQPRKLLPKVEKLVAKSRTPQVSKPSGRR